MPDPAAPAAPRGLVAPSSRPEAPVTNAPVNNAARGSVPAVQARTDRRSEARANLNEVGRGMKDGTITNTSVPVTPKSTSTSAAAANPANNNAPPKPGANPNPSTAPKPGVADSGAQTPEQKQAAAETAKKLSDAKRVLARDGYEPDELAAMSDDKLIARAALRAKHHAEVDRVMTANAQRQQPRTETGQFAPKAEVAPGTGQPPPAAGDPAAAAAALAQGNQAELSQDPEIAQILAAAEGQLGKPATQLLAKITNVLATRVGNRAQTAEMLVRQQLLNQGLEQFAEDYPTQATENPDAFTEVQANFGALLASGRYQESQIKKAWSDALHMQFGPPDTVQNEQRGMLARQTAAVNGAAHVGESRTPLAQAGNQPSRKDLLRKAGELMKNSGGKNLDQLHQALHS